MPEHDKQHEDEHKKHAKSHGHGGGHGGGHEEGHEGAPEWLISFADNVALLMGFFVIMLAMNMKTPSGGGTGDAKAQPDAGGPSPAMLDTIIGIRAAFNNPISPNSNDPTEMPFVARLLARNGDPEPQEPGPHGKDHDVQSLRPSRYRGVCGTMSFPSGSSALSTVDRCTAREVARRVRGLRFIIEVRGHVSAAEAARSEDRGMSLAYARALAAARALEADGVRWSQMRLMACADNDRLNAIAYNKAGHEPNQRVEILATDTVLPDYVLTNEPTRD